jgi:CrcB protein
MQTALLLSLGAILGAALRFGAGLWVKPVQGFPLAVLAVNLAGAALIGAFYGLAETRGGYSEQARVLFVVGFLGALTTFSSFTFETLQLWRERGLGLALGYVLANNLGCFALAALGWRLAGGK